MSTVLEEEVSGVSTGAPAPAGSRPATSPSRSASNWRAWRTSTPSASTAVTTERP